MASTLRADGIPVAPPTSNSRARVEATEPSIAYAAALLLLACGHHWLLCLSQVIGLHPSAAMVGAAEFLIYLGCVPLLFRRISPRIIAAILFMIGAITLLAIVRSGHLDIKAIRDLMIPALFMWAGRSWRGSADDLDRALRVAVWMVVGIGLFEAAFFDTYTRFINTFTYYVGTGGIIEGHEQVAGQAVTLNGMRPEGIGRTLLPQIFGSHRVSSVFLEPVSLGNFAIILLAWALAKPIERWRTSLGFIAAAMLLIVLADSRFAFYSMALLFLLRACVHKGAHYLAVLMPVLGIGLLLTIALLLPGAGDNLHGRLTSSGLRLLQFDAMGLLGFTAHADTFGDMGYAYAISRFGVPLGAILWLLLFTLPLPTEQARRFRTLICAYIALILCVSGTSVFALKTAGLLWFLFGSLSVQPQDQSLPAAAGSATRRRQPPSFP